MDLETLKMLIRSMMNVLVLWILLKKPMHGYEILNAIADVTGFKFSPGSVYPLLYKLERLKLIKSRWMKIGEKRRIKLYELTNKGKKELEHLKEKLRDFLKDLMSS